METCKICKRTFKTYQGLGSHTGQAHRTDGFKKKGRNQYSIPLKDRKWESLSHRSRKQFLFLERGYKCEGCGYSKNIFRANGPCILELHHIEGNKDNNDKKNLKILCPNCHALTDNFRFNSRTHGR